MINGKLKRGTTLNGSVRASNAEPAEEIFWCVRSATTYTEISNAIAANKLPMLYIPATREMYVYYSSSEYEHKFFRYSEINECFWIVGCRNTDSWYTTSYYYQPKLTFDGTPRLGSNNPVRSHGIYNAIEAAKVTVDSELSATSDNPVANRVIKAALDSLGEANLLIAEYGVTTISELEAAYQTGKQILCVRNGIIYPLLLREDNNTYQVFRFGLAFENEYRYLICNDGNSGQWSTTYVDYRDSGGGTPYDSNPAMDGTASAGSSDEYARGDHVHPTDTSKADKVTEVTVSTAGAVTQALDAGKIYHFTGAVTALTITLNAPASGDLAQYHFDFLAGSTAPTLTLPNTVTMPSGFAVEASKHYEIDILNNYGAVMAWATS